MFNLPLPVPGHTLYHEISVDPSASDGEVRWAVGQRVQQLTVEKGTLDQELQQLVASIDGFEEATRALAALRNEPADGTSQLADAQAAVARFEQVASARDPEYRRKRERSQALADQINTLTRSGLDGTEGRAAYDRAHPPLALLRLAEQPTGALPDVATSLVQLRHDLASFLAQRGEDVFHPSDLTRDDFSADFTYQPLLDGERHEP